MKKLFIILLVIVFALTGVCAALSVLPHVHGHDFDHSKHSTCPVFQVSQICFAGKIFVFISFFIYLVSRRYFFRQASLLDFILYRSVLLRGPPVLA